jgi:hypothetical protein
MTCGGFRLARPGRTEICELLEWSGWHRSRSFRHTMDDGAQSVAAWAGRASAGMGTRRIGGFAAMVPLTERAVLTRKG